MGFKVKDAINSEEFISICGRMKADLPIDFVAVALQSDESQEIRWQYAVGNRNEKYKRMLVHYGKGIAGGVIASGSKMVVSDFPHGIKGKTTDYPIMLAEHLVSVMAVPVFCSGLPKGVVLIGKRTAYSFSKEEEQVIGYAAKELEMLLTNNLPSSRGERSDHE